jgi:hypothetical protein
MIELIGQRDRRLKINETRLRKSQGKLAMRTGVAVDKVAERFRNVFALDIATGLDFERDLFGNVPRPVLKGVESNDTDRVVELPRHEIGDDCFGVGPLDFGFTVHAGGPSKTIDYEVDGLIRAVGHVHRRLVGLTHTQLPPSPGGFKPEIRNCSYRKAWAPDISPEPKVTHTELHQCCALPGEATIDTPAARSGNEEQQEDETIKDRQLALVEQRK